MTDQRTPEIPETPETHGALETNLSRTGATALEFRHRFSTTSLSPYGMSFWALILAACGGGGGGGGGPVALTAAVQPEEAPPEKLTREGYVYDGPVKGAVVYVDVNDDGQLNPGIDEYVGTTTSTGEFRGSISARNNGKRYIVDLTKANDLGDDKIEGTEDDQDLSEFGIWLAPEGASVVSALTHLIATGVYNELEVKSTFPGFDPLRDNPYKQGLSPEKEAVFEIVRKALPGITRLVKENKELIQKNTLKIERNSEDLRALKDEINELKAKVAAIKQVAAQSSSQELEEPSAPTTSLPNPTPAPIPPANAAPTGVALSRTTHSVDEGSTVSGALTRITITDDGLGTVTLRPLPQNSIFEYQKISRVVYELHLKTNLTLDQSKVGEHRVIIQATGNGVGDNPAAETFILTVRDGAQVSQPDPALPTNLSPPVVPTDDEVSTLAIRLRDPDAQQTEIRETPGGLLSPENSGPRARETGFFLDVIKNGTNMVNFFGGLTYSPLQVEWDAQTGPKYRIERKTSDGTYELELRFVIRDNGKLSLRPDRVLDYEAETGPDGRPNGLIELRITIAEAKKKVAEAEAKKGVEATFDINIQLTNVNERPSGPTPPEGGNRGSINLMYGDEDSRSVYKPYDSDRPRLLPNTEFSINKEAFSDIDGDVLHHAYQWFKVGSASNRLLLREETFTPTAAGWYQLGLRVSDRPLNSDFTIPSGGFGLDYSQSFEVFEPTPLIGGEGALSLSIAENTTWDSALAAIDFANNGDRIAGTYKIHSVNGRYMSEHPLFKMDSRGSQLWLKTLETTLDHERVVSDDQGDLQLLNSYEIVLRHYLQLGSNLGTRGDVTFTLNVTNVEESPEIKFRNNITELQFAADNTRDTGGRITINDPDVPVIRPENDPVTYELSETAFLNGDIINSPTSRFELIMLDQASYWRGAPNGSTYYKIMAKTGQTFTPGEAITLTITANDHNGNADKTTAHVLIIIQSATSGQNAGETPGYRPLDYGDDPNPLPDDNLGLLPPDIS
jgi:hypothetical protein